MNTTDSALPAEPQPNMDRAVLFAVTAQRDHLLAELRHTRMEADRRLRRDLLFIAFCLLATASALALILLRTL